MNKLCVIPLLVMLSGCSHFLPVSAKFPDAPTVIAEKCEKLKLLDQGAKLSDVMIAITENYMKYHECSAKVDGWKDWYEKQKIIFDKAGK